MSLIKIIVKHKIDKLHDKIGALDNKDLVLLGLKNATGVASKAEKKLMRKYQKWAHKQDELLKKYFPEDYEKLQRDMKAYEEESQRKAEEARKKEEEERLKNAKSKVSDSWVNISNDCGKVTTLAELNAEKIENLNKQISSLKKRVSKLEKEIKKKVDTELPE